MFAATELVVSKPGAEVVLTIEQGAKLMLIGGEPFSEKHPVYWNLVSSRRDRIEQAKDDWRAMRFPGVPDKHEFVPMPEEARPAAHP